MSYSGNFSRVFPPPYGQQFVNYQGLLINVLGTTGPFLMPQNQPLNTLNLLTVTSMAGVPTSTPPGGSFAYNSTTNVVYVYIAGTGWVPITGGGAVETWAQTLVAGNTSGATNPVLSAGRTLIFEDNICIGGSNLPLTSTTAAILIGDGIVPGGLQCVQVGKSAVATAVGCTLIGSSTTGTGASATALGYGAQALGAQATALAYKAQCTTNATAVGVNSVANGAQSSAFGYNATAETFLNSTALGTGATSVQNNEVVLGTQTTVTRIAGTQLQFGQDPFNDVGIAIGTLLSPAAANLGSVAIGLFASAAGSSSTCVGNGVIDGAFNFSTLYGRAAACTGASATAVGNSSKSGLQGAALGSGAWATGTQSVALGFNANTGAFTKSVGLGAASTPTANNQIRMGTATETVSVPGALVMPSALAVGETFKFLTLSGVAGTPTGAALEGSLAMDTTNHLAYLRTNTAWVRIQTGAGATPTWNAVLTAGNTTGAVNPVVSSGQALIFTSGVCIGSNNTAPATATPTVTAVVIGGGATGSGTNIVVIGRTASSGALNNAVVIGQGASTGGAASVVIGRSASALSTSNTVIGDSAFNNFSQVVTIGSSANGGGANSVNVGHSSATTGSGGTAYGYASSAAQDSVAIGPTCSTNTSTGAIVIGSLAALAAGCTNSILIGGGGTALAAVTGAVAIGPSAALNSIDAIGIGRACGANGQSSVNIGLSVANHANNSNCVLVGPNISNTQTGNTGNVAIGPSITFTAGANSTNNVALGNTVTVPAGSVKTVYLQTGLTTVAASVAVNYNTATGQLYPVTSARKFKQNIHDLEAPERILNAIPRKYNMAKGHCHCPPLDGCDGTCCEEVGVIADEMEAAGLSDFVVYADHERKEAVGVLYDRLVVPLIAVVKSQQERLDILEKQLAKLLSSKL